MKPATVAVAAALISGTAMYTAGVRTATVDAFTQDSASAQSLERHLASARPVGGSVSLPAARTTHAASRTTSRGSASVNEAAERDGRSWTKSTLIIGGSAASGAGVGAIVDGKKGALIGAAIGGGAASIYEATRRR